MALMSPLAAALAESGIATWNIEYRRLGNDGGGWPGTYQDLARAADYVKKMAPQYHLDTSRVIVIGHSSGGHLALWLAARPKLPKTSILYSQSPIPLVGAVDIDGPPDLAATHDLAVPVCGSPADIQFMGGSPKEFPDRYAQGSASNMLPLGIRQEFFTDELFGALIKSYVAMAKRAGDSVELFERKNGGHFALLDPRTLPAKQLIEDVRSMLGMPK
jgi:acetyl esterase/lipase